MPDNSYFTGAYEEIYKHPDWRMEAEDYEQDVARALYNETEVKQAGAKALNTISRSLIRYNNMKEAQSGSSSRMEYLKAKADEIQKDVDFMQKSMEGKELPEGSPEKKELENLIKKHQELQMQYKEEEEKGKTYSRDEMVSDGVRLDSDDEGGILASLMLGGKSIGGNGYSLTDGGFYDIKKAGQYIDDVRGENGRLIDQMALIDNAVNTGGVELEEKYGAGISQNGAKYTLGDMLRDESIAGKVSYDVLTRGSNDIVSSAINTEALKEYREKGMDDVIGTMGRRSNKRSIAEVANERPYTKEAAKRKKAKYSMSSARIKEIQKRGKEDNLLPEEIIKSRRKKYETRIRTKLNRRETLDEDEAKVLEMIELEEKIKNIKNMGFWKRMKNSEDLKRYQFRLARLNKGLFSTWLPEIDETPAVNADDKSKDAFKNVAKDGPQILDGNGFLRASELKELAENKGDPADTMRKISSDRSARNMLAAYKMLGAGQNDLMKFRLALISYMVPNGKKSIYDILKEGSEVGIKGDEDNLSEPAMVYEGFTQLPKEKAKRLTGGRILPHEAIFFKLIKEYNDQRKTIPDARRNGGGALRGIKLKDPKAVVRAVLDPGRGLDEFATLRMIMDETGFVPTEEDFKDLGLHIAAADMDLIRTYREKNEEYAPLLDRYNQVKSKYDKESVRIQQAIAEANGRKFALEKNLKKKKINDLFKDEEELKESGNHDNDVEAKIKAIEAEIETLKAELGRYETDVEVALHTMKDLKTWIETNSRNVDEATAHVFDSIKNARISSKNRRLRGEAGAEHENDELRKKLMVIVRIANRMDPDRAESWNDKAKKYLGDLLKGGKPEPEGGQPQPGPENGLPGNNDIKDWKQKNEERLAVIREEDEELEGKEIIKEEDIEKEQDQENGVPGGVGGLANGKDNEEKKKQDRLAQIRDIMAAKDENEYIEFYNTVLESLGNPPQDSLLFALKNDLTIFVKMLGMDLGYEHEEGENVEETARIISSFMAESINSVVDWGYAVLGSVDRMSDEDYNSMNMEENEILIRNLVRKARIDRENLLWAMKNRLATLARGTRIEDKHLNAWLFLASDKAYKADQAQKAEDERKERERVEREEREREREERERAEREERQERERQERQARERELAQFNAAPDEYSLIELYRFLKESIAPLDMESKGELEKALDELITALDEDITTDNLWDFANDEEYISEACELVRMKLESVIDTGFTCLFQMNEAQKNSDAAVKLKGLVANARQDRDRLTWARENRLEQMKEGIRPGTAHRGAYFVTMDTMGFVNYQNEKLAENEQRLANERAEIERRKNERKAELDEYLRRSGDERSYTQFFTDVLDMLAEDQEGNEYDGVIYALRNFITELDKPMPPLVGQIREAFTNAGTELRNGYTLLLTACSGRIASLLKTNPNDNIGGERVLQFAANLKDENVNKKAKDAASVRKRQDVQLFNQMSEKDRLVVLLFDKAGQDVLRVNTGVSNTARILHAEHRTDEEHTRAVFMTLGRTSFDDYMAAKNAGAAGGNGPVNGGNGPVNGGNGPVNGGNGPVNGERQNNNENPVLIRDENNGNPQPIQNVENPPLIQNNNENPLINGNNGENPVVIHNNGENPPLIQNNNENPLINGNNGENPVVIRNENPERIIVPQGNNNENVIPGQNRGNGENIIVMRNEVVNGENGPVQNIAAGQGLPVFRRRSASIGGFANRGGLVLLNRNRAGGAGNGGGNPPVIVRQEDQKAPQGNNNNVNIRNNIIVNIDNNVDRNLDKEMDDLMNEVDKEDKNKDINDAFKILKNMIVNNAKGHIDDEEDEKLLDDFKDEEDEKLLDDIKDEQIEQEADKKIPEVDDDQRDELDNEELNRSMELPQGKKLGDLYKDDIGKAAKQNAKQQAHAQADYSRMEMPRIMEPMVKADGKAFEPMPAPEADGGLKSRIKNRAGLVARYVWGATIGAVAGIVGSLISLPGFIKRRFSKKKNPVQLQRDHDIIPGRGGEKFGQEVIPQENGEDKEVSRDVRRIPLIWERLSADDAEQEPEIAILTSQAKRGSNQANSLLGSGHAILGLYYSRYSNISKRKERYRLLYLFGAGPGTNNFSMNLVEMGGVFMPGQLHPAFQKPYDTGRRYKVKPGIINRVLRESEKYPDGGYNVLRRNCSTFVTDMARVAGLSIDDSINSEMELDALGQAGLNVAVGTFSTTLMSTANMIDDRMQKKGESYATFGQALYTQQDKDNFKNSILNKTVIKKGPNPSALGQQLSAGSIKQNNDPGRMTAFFKEHHADGGFDYKNLGDDIENKAMEIANRILALESKDHPLSEDDKFFAYCLMAGPVPKRYQDEFNMDKDPKAGLEKMRSTQKLISDNMKAISAFYTVRLANSSEFSEDFLEMLSLMQAAMESIDVLYEKYYYMASDADTAAMRDGVTSNKDSIMYINKEGKILAQATTSGAMYEAYLMMGLSPMEAIAEINKYDEYKNMDDMDERMTGEQLAEYANLKRRRNLALDFTRANKHFLEKDSFTDKDMDYAFNALPKMENGNPEEGRISGDLADDGGLLASAVYQGIIFETIYQGLGDELAFRADWVNDMNVAYHSHFAMELTSFMLRKSKAKEGELSRILTVFINGKKKQGSVQLSSDQLVTEFLKTFGRAYILPVLKGDDGLDPFIYEQVVNDMEDGKNEFRVYLKDMIMRLLQAMAAGLEDA